jgi:hypothetical protein
MTPWIKVSLLRKSTVYHLQSLPEANYLVDSLKCKILNLDPFDDRVKQFYQRKNYQPCTQLALLTHTTTNSNVATLHVNTEAMQWYSSEKISCCYANITRSNLPNEFE